MNAFKRRRRLKNLKTSDRLLTKDKREEGKPTFESVVERVMRMRVSEGIEGNKELPSDVSPSGIVMRRSLEDHGNSRTSHGYPTSSNYRGKVSLFL